MNGKDIEIVSDSIDIEEDIENISIDERIKPFDPTKNKYSQ